MLRLVYSKDAVTCGLNTSALQMPMLFLNLVNCLLSFRVTDMFFDRYLTCIFCAKTTSPSLSLCFISAIAVSLM